MALLFLVSLRDRQKGMHHAMEFIEASNENGRPESGKKNS